MVTGWLASKLVLIGIANARLQVQLKDNCLSYLLLAFNTDICLMTTTFCFCFTSLVFIIITACTVVQAVVKATSQSNGKGQILTPWGSKTQNFIRKF